MITWWLMEQRGDTARGTTIVRVLAWHEGKATVIDLDSDGKLRQGSMPYMVRSSDLSAHRDDQEAERIG